MFYDNAKGITQRDQQAVTQNLTMCKLLKSKGKMGLMVKKHRKLEVIRESCMGKHMRFFLKFDQKCHFDLSRQ